MSRRWVWLSALWLGILIGGVSGAGLRPALAQYPGYGAYDTDPYRTRLHDYGTGYDGGLGFETPNYSVYLDAAGREYMTPQGYAPPPPLFPANNPPPPPAYAVAPPPRAQIYADPMRTGQRQAQLDAPSQAPGDYALGETANMRTGQVVANPDPGQRPGTIIVDTGTRHLYLVMDDGQAMEYGIGVGRDGFAWKGSATIQRKAEWPDWVPPSDMLKRRPDLPRRMAGGIENPLGARALYLYQGKRDTMFRIHGTNEPDTIGKAVSSGCIRMMNADVIDLYQRVKLGTKVVVL